MRALTCLLLATCLTLLMSPAQAATEPAPAREGAWPLAPRPAIASRFDPPASRWGAGHRGVDLAGRAGQGVRTSLGGTVTFAATLAGRGVVVVDHGAVRTTYEPVSASVHVGQQVGPGARIGTLQRASSHCFPRACLHWGLLQGETYLDPLSLVGAGPIRLLPLDPVPGDGASGGGPAVGVALDLVSEPTIRSVASPPLRLGGVRAGRPDAGVPW
jgi:murein DD-endopeptidase MepM/ murein hydrolase activator NlpD